MPYYPRSRNSERVYKNARSRPNPYVYRKPVPVQNIPPLMPSLITIIPSDQTRSASITPTNETREVPIIPTNGTTHTVIAPAKQTRDAATQTITRDKNLDPINFARLYINTQINGENMEEKRAKFFDDATVNENIRKSYRKFVEDHDNNDDKSKLTKVDRKYHLLDRTLKSKISHMTPDQIKLQYPGIGWDYLGLQARMEYQQTYCSQMTETATDERFFQDKTILTNLKIGYSRWKSDNISSSNATVLHINKSGHYRSPNHSQTDDEGVIPVSQVLPDPTLNTNILSMSLEEITVLYGSIDEDILGLQARMEYAEDKNKTDKDQGSEIVHNIDIDFMLDERVPEIIRSWYRKWLSTNQLIKRQDELVIVKVSNANNNKIEEPETVLN